MPNININRKIILSKIATVNPIASILATTPNLWIDSTYSTTTVDGSLKTSQINDLIGTNNATQATGSKQPIQFSMGLTKSLYFKVSDARLLTLPNSIKSLFQSSFTINIVAQSFTIGGTSAYFGLVDGTTIFYIWQDTSGKFEFKISNGTTTVTLTTNTQRVYSLYNVKPILITCVYDSSVNGIGGLKIYADNVLQVDNGTNRGNTTGYNAALFNPASINFGIGARNRTTTDGYFEGLIQSVMIHNRVLTSTERQTIYDFYTASN